MPKSKKCRNCKEEFEAFKTTEIVCSIACAIKLAKEKTEKEERFTWNKRKSELKEKLKTITEYEKAAKKSFQKFIRLRDTSLPCISCGNYEPLQFHAGHFFPADGFSGLIFDERNCNSQCSFCNIHKHGNPINYRIGLIKKIGEDKVLELEELANESRLYKFTKDELIDIKSKYDKLIKLKS
jgi:radical SAM superfamily enzyme YgiQ (UPF0313 family)